MSGKKYYSVSAAEAEKEQQKPYLNAVWPKIFASETCYQTLR